MKTLGFIGTGGMGSGMAANLIKAGYSLVVNDLRREQARGLESQGAAFKESPRAVAESCEMVLSMLPYNEAVRAVGLGGGGLHEAASGAKLWVDFSSIDKKTIVGVNAELEKKGWTVLDGSAGGVEEAAAAGTLSLWISGSKELFDQHQPVFKAMGKKILHVGELGNAKLVKNAMAMFAAIQHLGLAEIFSWLKKGGVTEDTFYTVLKNSAAELRSHRPDLRDCCQPKIQAPQVVDAQRCRLRARHGARDGSAGSVHRIGLSDVFYRPGHRP